MIYLIKNDVCVRMYIFIMCFYLFVGCNHMSKKTFVVGGIKVENRNYELGTVRNRQTGERFRRFCFVLENVTNDEIEFDSTEVSCSCLLIEHSPIRIMANGNDSISGKIDLDGTHGKLSKSIYATLKNGEVILLRVIGVVE